MPRRLTLPCVRSTIVHVGLFGNGLDATHVVVRRGSSDEQDFLRRLRQARADAGLTQIQVAKRLGRSQSFVTKAENGERRLDVVELRAFARIYRKRASYFLGE